MKTSALLWIGVSLGLEAVGDWFCKVGFLRHSQVLCLLSLLAYNLMLLAWFGAVRVTNEIAIPGVVWLLGGVMIVTVMGHCLFREAISLRQWVGILVGAVSLWLLCMG